MAPALEDVWSAESTTPAAIEQALRDLLHRRHVEGAAQAPARVLNLVAVVDRAWRGEIANRLEGVERFHPSRTILCSVSPDRTTIDAWAAMAPEAEATSRAAAVCRERVEIEVGTRHLAHLDTVVAGVLARDLPTLVWTPHGHAEAMDALIRLADVVLLDSAEDAQVHLGLARAAELAQRAAVVDLAWVRTTPFREQVFALFEPPDMRRVIDQISAVTVRHRHDSTAPALLLVGWLASRLGWKVNALVATPSLLQGKAGSRRQDVALRLEPILDQESPGIAGVTVETATGLTLTLDRVPGGLAARRRTGGERESACTILRVSRGEIGIFEEAVRQALARDATYPPALDAARRMLL